jgi:hypothetical protein
MNDEKLAFLFSFLAIRRLGGSSVLFLLESTIEDPWPLEKQNSELDDSGKNKQLFIVSYFGTDRYSIRSQLNSSVTSKRPVHGQGERGKKMSHVVILMQSKSLLNKNRERAFDDF